MEAQTLSSEIWQILRPSEHIHAFLKNDVRWDGRSLLERRPLSVKRHVLSIINNPYIIGSAQLQLGGSIVLVGIRVLVIKYALSEISTLAANRALRRGETCSGDVGESQFLPTRRYCSIIFWCIVCTVSLDHMVPGRAESKEPSEMAVELQHSVQQLLNK
jgi:hypothetical protein